MKNIIVLKQHSSGTSSYSLSDPKIRQKIYVLLSAAIICILLLGVGAGYLVFNSQVKPNTSFASMQLLVGQKEDDIQQFKSDVNHNLDSLAQQIGKLYAQSMRINALGERLTEVVNLDENEFDFSIEPGIGGAGLELTYIENTPEDLYNSLYSIESSFLHQEQQLRLLNTLLEEQRLDNQIKPSGQPIQKGWISSSFGGRPDPFTGKQTFHAGIDFGGEFKATIQSVADGVVIWASKHKDYGNVIEIDHGAGYITRYAHLSKISVKIGEKVHKAQAIGVMGKTGRATSEHLHFEVIQNGKKVNPWPFLAKK
ncbi:MAG: M23 family metallopeptidase [Proteobacteria bacterium]|nr:M23 family metallopeptidase [Pseudomonadota bacterium]